MTSVNITGGSRTVVLTEGDGKTVVVEAPQKAVTVATVGLGPQGPGGALAMYGTFIDTTDQPLISTETAQPLLLDTVLEFRGVTVEGGSRIVFSSHGTYKITVSLQVTNFANTIAEVNFFFKKNSLELEDTNTRIDLRERKSASVPYHGCFAIEIQITVAPDDYVELFWVANTLGVSVDTIPANGTHPRSPGAIINVAQIMFLQTTVPAGENTNDILVWDAVNHLWKPVDLSTLLPVG